tara:strand:+ start:432 stop:839 length:408 start_codon:yes stop_codon:yes gene_type:complete
MSEDGSNIGNYSIKLINEVSREIEEEVKSNLIESIDPEYLVLVEIKEDQIPLIINTNGTVAKYRVEIVMSFEIIKIADNETLSNGTSRGFAQYDVGESEINNENTKKRMAKNATKSAIQIMISKIQSSISRDNDN